MIEMTSRAKRAATIVTDALLGALAPILARTSPEATFPANPRVLIVRCDHVGDAAMATAVIGPIRRALNASCVDVLAGPWGAPLFEHQPSVDRVIEFGAPWWLVKRARPIGERLAAFSSLPRVIRSIRAGRYDIGIDLRGDLRQIFLFLVLGRCRERISSDRTGGRRLLTRVAKYDDRRHEVEQNLAIARLLGVDGDVELVSPALPTLPADLVEALRAAQGPNGFITVSAQGTKRNRSWPARYVAALAELAATRLGLGTVYIGGPEDLRMAEQVATAAAVPVAVLAGRLSLLQSLAVLARARASVAVDSGPMHLAALVGTPVVALFGPSDPFRYRPWTSRCEVAAARAPCGCVDPDCIFTASGPGACMIDLAPSTVYEALKRVLRSSSSVRPLTLEPDPA